MTRPTLPTQSTGSSPRIFIAELAPEEIGINEIKRYLGLGLNVILNLNLVGEGDSVRSEFGEQIRYTSLPLNEESLIRYITESGGCDVLKVRRNFPITEHLFSSLSSLTPPKRRLRILAQSGTGLGHIDKASALHHKIEVIHTPGVNAEAVAEHALRSMLMLASRAQVYANDTAQGLWSKGKYGLGSELRGKTLGLIGMGASATLLANFAVALGMEVLGFGGSKFDDDKARQLGVTRANSLDDLLAASDYVSLHVPLTDETRGMIGTREITIMKRGALLINASRGGVIDEAAVAHDLRSGKSRLGGVAVDVFESEGEKFTSPLVGAPNALLTPHIAGSTTESLALVTTSLIDQIRDLLST